MGSIVQQINLYRGDEDGGDSTLSSRVLLVTGVGALLGVLVMAIVGEFYLAANEERQRNIAEQLRQQQDVVGQYRSTLKSPGKDPFLETELSALRRLQGQLASNLAAVKRHQAAAPRGFSRYFSGLARNTLDGLWLEQVDILDGGREMALRGMAVEPSLVPRLLQDLSGEDVFAGRSFRQVSFTRGDGARAPVVFELRSANAREDGDAG